MRTVVVQQSGEWINVFVDVGCAPSCLVVMDDLSEAMETAGMMAAALRMPVEIRPEAQG
jgi:broad specificity phosphatase PhoE